MIGGFHLFNKSEDEVRAFARQMRDSGVGRICTGHCTGSEAYSILEQELGDKVSQFSVGLVMDL